MLILYEGIFFTFIVIFIFDLNSSHWFTAEPLEGTTLQSMLTRILAVREVHQEQDAARQSSATADEDSLQWYAALLIRIPLTESFSDAKQFAVNSSCTFIH